MPYKAHQTGAVLVHIAMIVILVAAGMTRYMGYEGVMPIREGATTDYILSAKDHVRVTGETQEASFPVRLYKRQQGDIWQKVMVDGQEYELGVADFWPHFAEVYQAGPGGPAGFQYRVSMDGEIVSKVMTEGERTKIGSVNASLRRGDFRGDASVSPYGDLRVRSGDEVCTIPVGPPDGSVHTCGGLELEITEFQTSFVVGGPSRSDGPMDNPMIRVAIKDDRGRSGERVFFAYHPEFSMGHSGAEDPFADLDMAYTVASGIEFVFADGKLRARASFPIEAMDMSTEERSAIAAAAVFDVTEQMLYVNDDRGFSFMPMRMMDSVVLVPAESEDPNAPPAARVVIRDGQGNEASAICVKSSRSETVELNDRRLRLGYGPIKIPLSYSLTLDDFVLNTYPGSDNPATYESYVLLNDPANGIKDQREHIYMNHPLSYGGAKHFQSSYDPDRKGTVLSVNFDPGKYPTYFGYFLITLGFVLVVLKNVLFPHSSRQSRVPLAVLAVLLTCGFAGQAMAQDEGRGHSEQNHAGQNHAGHQDPGFVSLDEPARELASRLVIQDFQGRMKPLDTLAREMTMKVAKSTKFHKEHPVDMFLNWSSNPPYWWKQDVIGVRHGGLKKFLGVSEGTKRVSMASLFEGNDYRLLQDVRAAHRTPDPERSKVQRKLISFDERFNLLYMTFQGSTLRLFPVPGDENNTWLSIEDVRPRLTAAQAEEYGTAYSSLMSGLKAGDQGRIMQGLQAIDTIQHEYGAAVIPSDTRLEAELFYNKSHLFSWAMVPLLGAFVLMMGAFFWNLFRHRMARISFRNPVYSLGLLAYLAGLGMMIAAYALRWIASGRAPLSNGHESLLFIAVAAVVLGFIAELVFRVALPASLSALLTVIILGVSMLSIFDPAIGPLVPVLVSYWLNIHVTIITASYAFFGLAFLQGVMSMMLILQRSFSKSTRRQETISFALRVLDKINFWILVAGLGMLSIGTLLGGVWANESWGRYWGWDPKETWSWITILVAAVGLHFRYIKSLRSIWLNAWWNWVVIDSVLMTYFGVNYFLVGLHSYGAGDANGVPVWVHIFNLVLLVLVIVSGVLYSNYKDPSENVVELA